MRKATPICILIVGFLLISIAGFAQKVSFKASAPSTVNKGDKFRIIYTLDGAEGQGIQDPTDIDGIRIIFGPGISSSSSMSMINGSVTQSFRTSFTYTAIAEKEGAFRLPAASIRISGKQYSSNTTQIKVLPAGKASGSNSLQDLTDRADDVNANNSFVKAIVSKSKIFEQEAFIVTYRVYSLYLIRQVGEYDFPEFEGFIREEVPIEKNPQLRAEIVGGKKYFVADLQKYVLFPQRSGRVIIPSGKAAIIVEARSGRQVETFAGAQNLSMLSKIKVVTNPLTMDIQPLPNNKPNNFANAVGSFTVQSSISQTKVKANDPVTISVNISGSGNLKLIKTPELKLPAEFEVYDPKIENDVQANAAGLSGSKKIEYLFIPRQEGSYDIPVTSFSFFDPSIGTYKELQIPAYKIDVAKDPNGGNNSATSYNESKKKVPADILPLKTGDLNLKKINKFIISSLTYSFGYIIPIILFIAFLLYYRKQLKESADVTRTKTKRANKVAIKRLVDANAHLKANNKEKFFEEVLRATWGYLSDKLSIPVAELSRENVEIELNKFGAPQELIASFIFILDTCEYARYAPNQTYDVMDNFYEKAVDTISEMENRIKAKK